MKGSMRLQKWNYGWRGVYFITINCSGKQKFFGKVVDGKMVYSTLGIIANGVWGMIPSQFPYAIIDQFQLMPDHFNGIIRIEQNQILKDVKVAEGQGGFSKEKNPMIYQNISRIVRWFKGRCSYECRKINPDFKWQSTFDDKILRSKIDLIKVRKYIRNNPKHYKVMVKQ